MRARRFLGHVLTGCGLIGIGLAFVSAVVGQWLDPSVSPNLGDALLFVPGFGALVLGRRLMASPDSRRPRA